jgi:hypothetical protein
MIAGERTSTSRRVDAELARRGSVMSSATLGSAVVIEDTTPAKSRGWWRRESARLGSDWNGIMELRASVALLTCDVYGSAPGVNPSFCAACRLADQQRRRPSPRERAQLSSPPRQATRRITVPDDYALMRLVRLIAEAQAGERTQLTYWAACRAGEMVPSGVLDAHGAAAVIAEAATRAGLSRSEAEHTAWGGIRRTGGVHA